MYACTRTWVLFRAGLPERSVRTDQAVAHPRYTAPYPKAAGSSSSVPHISAGTIAAKTAAGCTKHIAQARPMPHPRTVVYIPMRKLANRNSPSATKNGDGSDAVMVETAIPISRASIHRQHPNAEECSDLEYSRFRMYSESRIWVSARAAAAAATCQYPASRYHHVATVATATTMPIERHSEKYREDGVSRVSE